MRLFRQPDGTVVAQGEGQIDFVASDAHDADRRACHFQDAYAQLARLVGMPCADKLTGNRRIAEDQLIR